MDVCFECCAFSGRGLRDEPIICPESRTHCGALLYRVQKPHELGRHGPRWAATPQKKITLLIPEIDTFSCRYRIKFIYSKYLSQKFLAFQNMIFLFVDSFVFFVPRVQKIMCFGRWGYNLFLPKNIGLHIGASEFPFRALVTTERLTLRWLMSYIYIWSTHSWCF